jgi:hypothetical protein
MNKNKVLKEIDEEFNRKFPQFREFPKYFQAIDPRRDRIVDFYHQSIVKVLEAVDKKLPASKNINGKFSTDERRYPHGFNACRNQVKKIIKEFKK